MIKIGIICPSEIAFRRFLPALSKHPEFEYVGVAIASCKEWFGEKNVQTDNWTKIQKAEEEKANNFKNSYGGKIFNSYTSMITSKEIDAIYIPLPPALHYKWAMLGLENNLHVFVEKPSATSLTETENIINLAKSKDLAVHENYMFIYHTQLEEIKNVVKSGKIGDVRLTRIDFGFPNRGKNDFRYIKNLGGGALLDCGGYTFKYASHILGKDVEISCANVGYKEDYEVEIFGSATLTNKNGEVVQASFGMDNDYRCSIEIWGSKGTLKSERVLTAPAGFKPTYKISKNGNIETYNLSADDAFYKSISKFYECISNKKARLSVYDEVLRQENLVEQFAVKSGLR